MNTQKPKLIFVLLAVVLGLRTPKVLALTISRDAQPQAVIVLAADATESEQHAAAELSDFLTQITGAKYSSAPARQSRQTPISPPTASVLTA